MSWDESNVWRVMLKSPVLARCVSESLPVPLPGQFGSSTDRLVPHDGEVGGAGEVLGDGDRRVQVEDHVPPAACGHTASHNQHHTERRWHD